MLWTRNGRKYKTEMENKFLERFMKKNCKKQIKQSLAQKK